MKCHSDCLHLESIIVSRQESEHACAHLVAGGLPKLAFNKSGGVKRLVISIFKHIILCSSVFLVSESMLTWSCEQTNEYAVPYVVLVHCMHFQVNTTHRKASLTSTLLQPSGTRRSTNVTQTNCLGNFKLISRPSYLNTGLLRRLCSTAL